MSEELPMAISSRGEIIQLTLLDSNIGGTCNLCYEDEGNGGACVGRRGFDDLVSRLGADCRDYDTEGHVAVWRKVPDE